MPMQALEFQICNPDSGEHHTYYIPESRINFVRLDVPHDLSPDTGTPNRVFIVFNGGSDLTLDDHNCPNFDRVVQEIRRWR